MQIIQHYTREAGVRNLEREIGAVARKVATRVAEGEECRRTRSRRSEMREYLGRPRFFYEELAARTSQPGVAIGVGVTACRRRHHVHRGDQDARQGQLDRSPVSSAT